VNGYYYLAQPLPVTKRGSWHPIGTHTASRSHRRLDRFSAAASVLLNRCPLKLKLTRFPGARQAFNGGFSDAQDASALFT
jgi:hypothetical protein